MWFGAQVPSMTHHDAEALCSRGEAMLVDVREPEEHAAGNIGGINIPLGTLSSRIGELPRDKHLIVYCRSGARSAQAVRLLATSGFSQVSNLEGGLLAR